MDIDIEKKQEPNNEEAQEWVNKVYQYTIDQMVNNHISATEMKTDLIQKGLSSEAAETVVGNVEAEISKAKKERGKKDMLYGALWCIGGIVVTVATYSAASGGGSYVVTYGAIIWGAIQFFRGLSNS